MRLFGLDLRLTRATPVQSRSGTFDRGWRSVVREPFTGAWQQNQEIAVPSVVANPAVFSCVTLIASDVAKMRLRLVEETDDDVWIEVANPAYSPVLRKPNRYQTIIKFVETWIVSKLLRGNAFVLKQRDARGVVSALYVLDPSRVTPLVAADGGVYYQLQTDDLNGIPPPPDGTAAIVVPASEMIHDLMVPLFHPLIGVSPIFACGLAALQGLKIQDNSSTLFGNGSNPGGVLTAPGAIADDTAQRLKKYWDENFTGANVGKVAVLGDGLKYEQMTMSAVDSQLIEQLRWTGETICSCFHVPAFMIGAAPPPSGGPEQWLQIYYAQCLHALVASFELSLDEGLELNAPLGTEFDVDDLIWMDTATRVKAAADAIGSGALSPDEARQKYFGLGPVPGGDTPYLQQQYFSLAALAERDAAKPFAKPTPAAPATPATPADDTGDDFDLNTKALTAAVAWTIRNDIRNRLESNV